MEIDPQKYRVAFVFNTIYYPFTYPEILNSLAARGYSILVPPQPPKSGARIYISGQVAATKATIAAEAPSFIDINEPKKIIACEGASLNNVMASVTDIINLSQADFGLNLPDDIDFIEFSGTMMAYNNNPRDAIKKFCGDRYNTFSDILGAECAGGAIRLVPRNGTQMDRKWFDISISERVPARSNSYFIEIVFRDGNNIAGLLSFISNLNTKIAEMINRIGGIT